MSDLKPGALCVIIGGCPENIGLIVEIIRHLGACGNRENAYSIRTVSGRTFHQFRKSNGELIRANNCECITDRHKLRPLVDPKENDESLERESGRPEERQRDLVVNCF
jgi:hypothetical protein